MYRMRKYVLATRVTIGGQKGIREHIEVIIVDFYAILAESSSNKIFDTFFSYRLTFVLKGWKQSSMLNIEVWGDMFLNGKIVYFLISNAAVKTD